MRLTNFETAKSILAEAIRATELAEIQANPRQREALEAKYGRVWTTDELRQDFDVIGFMAPYMVVKRKSDGIKGSFMFQHSPRFYFSFQEDRP